ncbi:MAG: BON domain-containing protein [Candidatus Riflebacteria bacterium]|nr:BON domain-containing protein [Candidatus Riflebacteria bacterium]
MYLFAFAVIAVTMLITIVPLFASSDDDKIQSLFVRSYVYQTYLKGDAIRAEVKDGVVTLTGAVSEEFHKALAQDTAGNLPGVLSVVNQLQTIAEVVAENPDKGISQKVKLTLQFHRNSNGGNTVVDVKDGIVTLKGEALDDAQKQLVSEYAKDVEGVKDVKVEMTVGQTQKGVVQTASDEKIDDPSITALVKMALLTHRSTRSINTKIETHDGEVTLTGSSKSATQKALVTKLVSDIRGVTSVKNQIAVDE